MRTVLFGLDGATYTVLDHLMAEGVMPNLAEFCRRGCRATLLSTPHPLTPQAWTTLATGRSAGHHGIHDFLRREANANGVFWRVNDARDNSCETIWKYASRHGKRVTVLNYYGTAPPEPLNGHSMPGFVSGRHLRRSSYPPDLFERLRGVAGLDVKVLGSDPDFLTEGLQDMPPERWCAWIGQHVERDRAWLGVLGHLMGHEPSDLTAVVLDGVDRIQHLAYAFLDPALVPAEPTPWEADVLRVCRAYFRQVDDFLGRVVERLGPWGRVFVASDHGFTASREVFYVNKWLHDQGWLSWRGAVPEDEHGALLTSRLADLTNSIDLPGTRAYALTPSCNGIHLSVPPAEYESFREELARRLYQVRGPDGGQVVTRVVRREEAFSGPYVDRIPDLTLRLRDFGCVSVLNSRRVVAPRKRPAGTHHPHGVLLGKGPGVREGADAGPVNILDVAPLLLHSIGLTIPAEFEGTFPAQLYEPAYLESDPPRVGRPNQRTEDRGQRTEVADAQADETDQALILERLRSLGYIE